MVPRMAAGVLAVALLVVAGGRPPLAEGGDAPDFSNEQLDAMVAPIALYPDELLAQIFMASTYPLEVVEADRWRSKEKGLSGEALEKALATSAPVAMPTPKLSSAVPAVYAGGGAMTAG